LGDIYGGGALGLPLTRGNMREVTKRWYKLNMAGLAGYYRPEQLTLITGNITAMKIGGVTLPVNFYQTETNLLIIFPPGDLIFQIKPNRFYINQGLRLNNGDIPGHYYENGGYNDLGHINMARYCFHLKEWKPSQDVISGTTIYDILEAIYKGLSKL
jgi:hypothetical protein